MAITLELKLRQPNFNRRIERQKEDYQGRNLTFIETQNDYF